VKVFYETAIKKSIPVIIAGTKFDLPNSNIDKINNELKKLKSRNFPIVKTSAKEVFGIEELVSKISIYVKKRELVDSDLSFIILGFTHKKGIGELLNVGIKSGVLELRWITDK